MLDGMHTDATDAMWHDALVDAVEALHVAKCEHEAMSAWLRPDPETMAIASEIRRLRDENIALMRSLHAKADRLPDDLWTAYRDILDASGVRDHDSARADVAYRTWCANGRRGKRPTSKLGGLLDVWNVEGKPVSCHFEGFRRAARGARTWRDLDRAIRMLSEALDTSCTMPDDVVVRHIEQDAAIAALEDE